MRFEISNLLTFYIYQLKFSIIMKRILSIGALCAMLVLTGCKDKTFTVTFDPQGGSAVAAITNVMGGEKIAKPTADPTKTGFEFLGWYKEAAGTNAWNFESDVVNSNITLYAKWMEVVPNPNPSSNYALEETTPTTKSLTGQAVYQVQDGKCYIEFIDNAGANYASLIVIPNGSNVMSTYPISFSGNAGTAVASSGSEDGYYVNAPFVCAYSGGLAPPIFFLVSGNITLTDAGLTVSAKSYFGSTINITATWFVAPDYEFVGGSWGDYYENGTNNFDFELYTYGLMDGAPNGVYYYCDFNAATSNPAGNYTFVGGGQPGAAGTFFAEFASVVNGTPTWPTITGGTLSISASVITINLTSSAGNHTITYDGPISWGSYGAPARAQKNVKKTNFVERDNFSSKKELGKFPFKR